MTHADDWEPIRYRDLPDWVKEDSKPRRWIRNTYKTVFYGDPYDYMVQYTVDQGDSHPLLLANSPHIQTGNKNGKKPAKKPAKKISRPSSRLIYGVIIIIMAAAALVFLIQFLPPFGTPSSAVSLPANTSEASMPPTPQPTQSPASPSLTLTDADFRQSPKTTSFSYVIEGDRQSMTFTTFGGLSDFFSDMSHSHRYDPDTGVIMDLLENAVQNEYMRPFVEMIRKRSITGDDQAKIAISLVQRIPNNGNRYSRTGTEWYYPYETLHNNEGSAADKAVLLAYILNELGYETVLFEFPSHLAVGVKTSSRYGFYDTGFAFIEASRPTIITYEPGSGRWFQYIAKSAYYSPDRGEKSHGREYRKYGDAMRMKQLEEMGGNLNQSYKTELLKISDKYDLNYVSG